MKCLLVLLPNNLMDYLIEYDDTHNLMNLFPSSLALKWGPFSEVGNFGLVALEGSIFSPEFLSKYIEI